MKVLLDTPIWSLALRRPSSRLSATERRIVAEWQLLIRARRVLLVGPIRQELLSGIRDERPFERLRGALRSFPDEPLITDDYEEAARCSNRCRAAGVAGSAVDFLICGAALRRDVPVFTTDRDFARYATHLRFRLHAARR